MSVAIDYARGLSLDDPQTRSWRLIARGVTMLFARRAATLQLVAFSMAAWLAVGVVYWVLAGHLGALVVLTSLRLLAVFARVAITMTTLTAAARDRPRLIFRLCSRLQPDVFEVRQIAEGAIAPFDLAVG